MKHYSLKKPGMMGSFTDLFILGIGRAASFASDFTAAATQQTYNLTQLKKGDIVLPAHALVAVRTNVSGGSISAATGSVGITGALTRFIKTVNLLAAGDEFYGPGGVALTDSSGGTASDTIAAISTGGAAADQSPTRNAFASLALKTNALLPYVAVDDTKYLTFDLNTTGDNVDDITAGEIWIYASILRRNDYDNLREA